MKTIDDSHLSTVTGGQRPLSPEMQRRVNTWLDSLPNPPRRTTLSPEMQRRVNTWLESIRNAPDLRGLQQGPNSSTLAKP